MFSRHSGLKISCLWPYYLVEPFGGCFRFGVMGSKRRTQGVRTKRRARSKDEIDLAKVERLRAALARGEFGMDFDVLIERLVHAMRS